MKRGRLVALGTFVAAAVVVLLVVGSIQPSQPAARQEIPIKVEVLAQGLEVPWSIDFTPDGMVFFTERPGRIRVIQNGILLPDPVLTIDVAQNGEGGLLGLALHPNFDEAPYLYVYYTSASDGTFRNRVSRFKLISSGIEEEKILLDGIPGNIWHNGGRIKFGPDGRLYVTTGDARNASMAQDLNSLAGKILRINPDGSIPDENPWPNSPVLSYGHRNPQGLAWHSTSGIGFSTEHGEVGNDELNMIRPGKNYGWPIVQGVAGVSDFTDPIRAYTPAVAPSGTAFYDGSVFQNWRGSMFFAALRGEHLRRLTFSDDLTRIAKEDELFQGLYGRIRDVAVGPDGYIYFSTSNRDGRGSAAPDDDRILRIVPGIPSPSILDRFYAATPARTPLDSRFTEEAFLNQPPRKLLLSPVSRC